ncbi:MAG: UDP-2,3-diacylglucosamine diphosphatase [Bacteroidales bacterium]|nr:UDP-2,3-diacylglucosamine diphosphatase [Bacteroidales bacterium]NLK80721.1 UDP-2,3-diacylglucosamine diphosphatase [Bacteroidales bacterium]HPY82007.1 UDP-2,3-diacylglucosamine diphosphatase [Bacteroidales bacterium]
MNSRTHIYFASDFHLGYPNSEESRIRELRIITWLSAIQDTCKELYLLGDVFDFWYEYKWVVPKGYVRFLAKLAEFVDSGIPVYICKGNHDQWYQSYLEQEIGAIIFDEPIIKEYNSKLFYIHHGHALGKYDAGMNFLHSIFTSKFLQWCFSRIHPNTAFGIAHRWSAKNRKAKVYESAHYLGDSKEWLLLHAHDILKTQHIDYFIFGHRHIALNKQLTSKSRYINTGNWITNTSYAMFDGTQLHLKIFMPDLFPEASIIY